MPGVLVDALSVSVDDSNVALIESFQVVVVEGGTLALARIPGFQALGRRSVLDHAVDASSNLLGSGHVQLE